MPFISTLGATALALLLLLLVLGGCLQAPRLAAGALLAVLFFFASSTWGQVEVESTIYSRGTGFFYLSLLNLGLLAAGAAVMLRRLAHPGQAGLAPPLGVWTAAFAALMAGHVAAGLLSGAPFERIIGYSGIVNVLNMLVFTYLIVAAFRALPDQQRLLTLLLLLAGLRLAFGLARFLWFDGDSANPYRNFERIDIKIFFFDIADNFIAALAAFLAAWLLLLRPFALGLWQRAGLLMVLLAGIASVALSYRRASLMGVGLMMLFLFTRVPGPRRALMAAVGALALAGTTLLFFEQRLQHASSDAAVQGGNVVLALFYDLLKPDSAHENRLYEWWAAADSLADNWVLGIGSWGSFTGDQGILDYHFGKFDYVHSGFGHVLLKSGLLGLLLFCGLFAAALGTYLRHARRLEGVPRLMADAGVAGLLFWLPTMVIGTPVIEFRSMLMLGLALALPFLAASAADRHARP